jgi:septum site-determining protein MinC
MNESSVTFKATANDLILIFREEDSFDLIKEEVERKLESSGRFFKGATISVKYRGKKLSEDEEKIIRDLMVSKAGVKIKDFKQDLSKPVTIDNNERNQSKDVRKRVKLKKFFFSGIDVGMTKFYRGTVRSGQLLSFDGNLVVIGDVNPGAELEATGNVVVMGSLKGIVHAGMDGNREAFVVAYNLQPTQLRIADLITRSPDEKEIRNIFFPEIAFIKDNKVYIDRLRIEEGKRNFVDKKTK